MRKEIKVFAPASVTNVSCGFDIMGFALDWPGDELVLRVKKQPGIVISKITNDKGKLPLDPHQNTAGSSLISMMNELDVDYGIELEIHKKMPLGSGLGSSAASAVASVFALNEILGRPLNKEGVLPFALEGEKIASGGKVHADNVAACLYGGFIIVRSLNPLEIFNIDYPLNLHCTIIHPHIELHTAEMRRIIRENISLSDAVQQWGNIACLVAGLIKSDFALIERSLQDVIIEPIRSKVIPGFEEAKKAAISAGALGSSISGSGPSIFALSTAPEIARKTADAMSQVFNEMEVKHDIYISKINRNGPKIIE
jgi:homoserine kinase